MEMYVALVVVAVIVTAGVVASAALRTRVGGAGSADAEVASLRARLAERSDELETSRQAEHALLRENRELAEKIARLEAQLDAERARLVDAKVEWEALQKRQNEAFQALSAQALERNSESFLRMAKSTFEQQQSNGKLEHEQRVRVLGELVKPLKESLERVDKQFGEIERERLGSYQALRTQVDELHKTTGALSNALRAPKARGRWGEIHLKRVVELSGLQDRVDFSLEVSGNTDDGLRRPDMVVHLPGGRSMVVDAKTPLDSYLDALSADEGPVRDELLQSHARRVREHVKDLGSRKYARMFDRAPEFVVLFIPNDAMYGAAVEHDAALIEFALERNVHIATPTTLISILRAVAQGWKEEAIADDAKMVVGLGKELHSRIDTLIGHWARLAKHLSAAVGSYNESVRSVESRLLPTTRKLAALHAEQSDQQPPALDPIDVLPVRPAAPELALLAQDSAGEVSGSGGELPLRATVLGRPES